jgi:hypothetical protein
VSSARQPGADGLDRRRPSSVGEAPRHSVRAFHERDWTRNQPLLEAWRRNHDRGAVALEPVRLGPAAEPQTSSVGRLLGRSPAPCPRKRPRHRISWARDWEWSAASPSPCTEESSKDAAVRALAGTSRTPSSAVALRRRVRIAVKPPYLVALALVMIARCGLEDGRKPLVAPRLTRRSGSGGRLAGKMRAVQ